jgi:uncharacterized membrane protein
MAVYLVPLLLLVNGVAAGMMLSTVVGVVPMFLTLSYPAYVRAVQFLWPRYDPLMPVLTVTTAALDVLLAAGAAEPAARVPFAVGAALMVVVIAISLLRNVPINRYVMRLDPETTPGDWAERDPRRRWRAWNTLRTALTVLALLAALAATAALI